VVGAGGHALVAIEVLASGHVGAAGCLSEDGTPSADTTAVGAPMLGRVDELPALVAAGHTQVFVAVGSNQARHTLIAAATGAGAQLVTAVSDAAHVSPTAAIRPGTLVMPAAVVNALARIGTGVIINSGAIVEHECVIGDFAHIAPGAVLAGNVHVGEGTLVGVGARVIPGIRIGAWATVGAGAVVIEDVPDGATVVGVPARVIPASTDRG
jgi:sugar O-acyltransferase (sialic acid O-acetyltransferase NeuD family)